MRRRLSREQKRITELNSLIKKIYEDNDLLAYLADDDDLKFTKYCHETVDHVKGYAEQGYRSVMIILEWDAVTGLTALHDRK